MSNDNKPNSSAPSMPGFDPVKVWMSGIDTWSRMARENFENVRSVWQTGEGSFDPSSLWTTGMDTWTRLARENVERMNSFYDELTGLEEAAYQRAKQGAQELGEMMSESLSYAAEFGREWRKMGMEAARRGAAMLEQQ
ncbi:hypothetical protein [Haliangium sp.]|uniref:hypothetical protein n=1 Tax=Haliangium sp. TaxID=2663208 RepID=UPI003D117AE6